MAACGVSATADTEKPMHHLSGTEMEAIESRASSHTQ